MNQRKLLILNLLSEHKEVTVNELSERFSVSPSTIRRELNTLSKDGLIIRTHGGAKYQPSYENEPIDHSKRRNYHFDEKVEVAQQAAMLIKNNDTVLLHSSSITDMIPNYLTSKNITIATNSLHCAWKLKDNENCQLLLLGGEYFRSAEAIEGATTINQIRALHFNKAFFGCDGVNLDVGISTKTEFEQNTKKATIECCDESILVCEHQKFNKQSIFTVAHLDQIKRIVTDTAIEDSVKAEFKQFCEIISINPKYS